MEKKMYYRLDNGDTGQIVDSINACAELIDAEWLDATIEFKQDSPQDEAPEWIITPVWMTEEEFDNLPDAY